MILPLSEPVRMLDGSVTSELPVPKDTRLVINVGATNTDPALWGSDASEWRPERWLEPLPQAVEKARVPGVYSHMYVYRSRHPVLWLALIAMRHRMTFIGGNRACM